MKWSLVSASNWFESALFSWEMSAKNIFLSREKEKYINFEYWFLIYRRGATIDKGGKVLIDPYLLVESSRRNHRVLARSREFHQRKGRCKLTMNRSVVIDRKFAERTSREKKMIAARRSPVFSTVSRPSLISPVTHDAYSQLKIIIVQKRTRMNFWNISKNRSQWLMVIVKKLQLCTSCLSIVRILSRYEYSDGRKISSGRLRVWRVYLLFRNRKKVIKPGWNKTCRNLNLLEFTFPGNDKSCIDRRVYRLNYDRRQFPRELAWRNYRENLLLVNLVARFRGKRKKENFDGADTSQRIRSVERNVTSFARFTWILMD